MSLESVVEGGQETVTLPVRPAPSPPFDIWQTTVRLLLAAMLTLVLGMAVAVPAFELLYAGRIYPGVTTMGLPLGGLTPNEAAALLAQRAQPITGPKVILYDAGTNQRWPVSPADLGVHLDTVAILHTAYGHGRSDNLLASLQTQTRLLFEGQDVPEMWAFDQDKSWLYLQLLAEQVNRLPQDATLAMLNLEPQAIPGVVGRTVDIETTRAALFAQMLTHSGGEVPLFVRETAPQIVDATAAQAQIERFLAGPLTFALPPSESDANPAGPWTLLPTDLAGMLVLQVIQDESGAGRWQAHLDAQPIADLLATIAQEVHRDPVNARLDFDTTSGAVSETSPSQPGRDLDLTAALDLALAQVTTHERTVTLPLLPIEAEISAANAAELGIREMIGEGVSFFQGSSRGRATNIRVAAARFQGVIVPPGEIFSFNEHLGEVSAAAGYEESIIIWGDRTRSDVGGGVCQVSTTAFRAAFWAGYPIVERHAHAFRVGWYEPPVGLDATIYAPQVDFRFLNDSPHYLLIETEVNEAAATLWFRFYSTRPDFTVEMEGPFESNRVPFPEPIYEEDPSLEPGQQVQMEWPKDGLDVTIYRVFKKDGQEIDRDTFFSHFLPWAARFRVGPQPLEQKEAEATTDR
ncbi:MAG: VanW family protein [Chloroflexota bacterium]